MPLWYSTFIFLEPRSHLCCFLGYGIEHKGYHCQDPISQCLRISRHFIFWEHTTFNSLSKFKAYSTISIFTNPLLLLFPYDTSLDSSTILLIPPTNSPISSLLPLDAPPDLPLGASPIDSLVSPQEPTLPVDVVIDQTPPFPLRHYAWVRAPSTHLSDYSCFQL